MVDPAGETGIVVGDQRRDRGQGGTAIIDVAGIVMTVCTPGSGGQDTVPGIVRVLEKSGYCSQGSGCMFRISVTVNTRCVVRSPVRTPASPV
jgi:hypothetical protein